jgi:predicted XRE-type DNA-binding protein
VPLQPDTERLLRQRRDALADAEKDARAEAGMRYSEVIAEPRKAFLTAILEAIEPSDPTREPETQQDIAEAFGVSKGRVSQLVKEARAETGG